VIERETSKHKEVIQGGYTIYNTGTAIREPIELKYLKILTVERVTGSSGI
jgi:hypothetical protein